MWHVPQLYLQKEPYRKQSITNTALNRLWPVFSDTQLCIYRSQTANHPLMSKWDCRFVGREREFFFTYPLFAGHPAWSNINKLSKSNAHLSKCRMLDDESRLPAKDFGLGEGEGRTQYRLGSYFKSKSSARISSSSNTSNETSHKANHNKPGQRMAVSAFFFTAWLHPFLTWLYALNCSEKTWGNPRILLSLLFFFMMFYWAHSPFALFRCLFECGGCLHRTRERSRLELGWG